ncbi:MAG: sodium:calcium antiporter [Firmicutes bacterium]|nr:sodium:calcium antiporter [Bacillota bacterium]
MELFLSVILFCAGLAFIIKGGGFLVDSALQLGKITRMSTVFIGATFMAIATAMPELFLSIFAVTSGNHGLATGNAIGGMIATMALVLGLYITFMPGSVNKSEVSQKNIFLMVTLVVIIWFARDLLITWKNGIALLFGFGLYLYLSTKKSKSTKQPSLLPPQPICKHLKRKTLSTFLFGQILLIGGAFMLVKNGNNIATLFDLSDTFIGFTLIAIGTSAPELTTVFTSIKRKSGNLALGNILGSNIITATLLLGSLGLMGGHLPISQSTFMISLPVLAIVSMLAILPIMIKGRTYRWQGISLIVIYALYLVYLGIVQPA